MLFIITVYNVRVCIGTQQTRFICQKYEKKNHKKRLIFFLRYFYCYLWASWADLKRLNVICAR